MNTIILGIRNAFRNSIRSASIVLILGLSIGLSLVMLIAHQAVGQKINDVKSSIGNTITIQPAGYGGFNQAGNPLTTSQLHAVGTLSHVTQLTESLNDRLTTTGSASFGDSSSNNTTSLQSPIALGSLGHRAYGGGGFMLRMDGGELPSNFSLPLQVLGTNDPTSLNGAHLTVTSGHTFDGTKDALVALISTDMASKNSLSVGSTFQAYSTTFTVAGIFDSGTKAGNNTIVMSLPTLERLSGQTDDVTNALVTVDSIVNVDSVANAVKNDLGSNADVTTSKESAQNALQPLENIQNVSLYSLIGAAIAGGVIILLTMIMIVRERRREIGIMKAIGASNLRIMFQFMTEALTFTVLGAVVGLVIGIAGASPVTQALVSSTENTSVSSMATGPGQGFRAGGFGGGSFGFGNGQLRRTLTNNTVVNNIRSIQTHVGWSILLYGFGAALGIAGIGSAFAGWMIARVRPSEVMRAE